MSERTRRGLSTERRAELVEHWLKTLENPTKTLTAWELGFVGEMAERDRPLTDGQFDKLEEIYAEKTA